MSLRVTLQEGSHFGVRKDEPQGDSLAEGGVLWVGPVSTRTAKRWDVRVLNTPSMRSMFGPRGGKAVTTPPRLPPAMFFAGRGARRELKLAGRQRLGPPPPRARSDPGSGVEVVHPCEGTSLPPSTSVSSLSPSPVHLLGSVYRLSPCHLPLSPCVLVFSPHGFSGPLCPFVFQFLGPVPTSDDLPSLWILSSLLEPRCPTHNPPSWFLRWWE